MSPRRAPRYRNGVTSRFWLGKPATLMTASGVLLAGVVTFIPATASAQVVRRSPTGFNLFSVEQDVEVGRRAAAELTALLPLSKNQHIDRFLTAVTGLLATQTGVGTSFHVLAVNSAGADLLVLPDGTIFVDRGLLALARSEADVAAVIAHGMAHVVLRHGTSRASKAYLGKVGISALGGRGPEATPARIVQAVGGFGTSAAFLRFAQVDEYEADALGAEWLASAGYDPVAMATIFGALRRVGHTANAAFFDQHPPPADREVRIRNLANILRHGSQEQVGGFTRIRWSAGNRPVAPSEGTNVSAGDVEIPPVRVTASVPPPSTHFNRFGHPNSVLAIDYPDNWEAYQSGVGVSFVPEGGLVERTEGGPNLLQGVIVNQYEPFENDVERWNNSLTRNYAPFSDRTRRRGVLEDATDDLVRQILSVSTYLKATTGSARSEVVDGAKGYSVRLTGRSPITGQTERVTLYTRAFPDDHVVYMACVAAGDNAIPIERACARMLQSLRINDSAMNRQ